MCKPTVTNVYVRHKQYSVMCHSIKAELDYDLQHVVCIFECTCVNICEIYYISIEGSHVISEVTMKQYLVDGSCP